MHAATHAADAPSLAVLTDPDRAAAALDPDRRRLLAALAEEPDSASGLARRLGDSRQRLNYHLKALEEVGLVELREERRRGNCVERVLGAIARRFVLDPSLLGDPGVDPAHLGDRFSASHLIGLAARLIRELASLLERARRDRKRLATAGLDAEVRLADPSAFRAFAEELSREVARVAAKHDDDAPGARPFRLVAGVYPAPAAEAADRVPETEKEANHGA